MISFRTELFVAAFLLFGFASPVLSQESARERYLLDAGWKFRFGDPEDLQQFSQPSPGEKGFSALPAGGRITHGPVGSEYCEVGWRDVQLPHDWAANLPFDPDASPISGFKAFGAALPEWGTMFPDTSIGWYRRRFTVPDSDREKRISIEFDGISGDARVWLNGFPLVRNTAGSLGFRCDITDTVALGRENLLVVRCDATLREAAFYQGAGIYRHAWLVKTSAVHVPQWGTQINCTLSGKTARVTARTRVRNETDQPAKVTLSSTLESQTGELVSRAQDVSGRIEPRAEGEFVQVFTVQKPKLWSPESPSLYRVVTSVAAGSGLPDRVETSTGIRTCEFDAKRGFLLNGKPYLLKGVAGHQDHAGLGVALPDALHEYRVGKLKEMGCNAWRCAQRPPSPEFLDACDRLGMLVLVENPALDSSEQGLANWERLVLRDRNHPSVFLWSLCSGEDSPDADAEARIASTLIRRLRVLDPSRAITASLRGENRMGVNGLVDVRGWNYGTLDHYRAYRAECPDQPLLLTEKPGIDGLRGVLGEKRGKLSRIPFPTDPGAPAPDPSRWWAEIESNRWLSGGFVWSGFDCLGDPSPRGWPNVASRSGVMDGCGFAKDTFYLFQALWLDKPVVETVPRWTLPTSERGKPTDVFVFSNCEEVDLSLNGQSLGRRAVPPSHHLAWKVPYEPGALVARGYRGGRQVVESSDATAGDGAALQLESGSSSLDGNGEDVGVIDVSVVDRNGLAQPLAQDEVAFDVAGPGRIIGVANGSPLSGDSVQADPAPASRFLRAWWIAGAPNAESAKKAVDNFGEEGASWKPLDAFLPHGNVVAKDPFAACCTRFSLTSKEMAGGEVRLFLGAVAPSGKVLVNGRPAGDAVEGRAFEADITALLRPGDNDVAVILPVSELKPGSVAGVFNGAVVRVVRPAQPWKCRLFNGVAQVVVRASRTVGDLRITARAPGLAAGNLTIPVGSSQSRLLPEP